jgi:hypothetical protein
LEEDAKRLKKEHAAETFEMHKRAAEEDDEWEGLMKKMVRLMDEQGEKRTAEDDIDE